MLWRALAKDPAARFDSCAMLVAAAREALGVRDVVVVRDRRPLLLLLAGLLLAAAAAAAALVLTRASEDATAPLGPVTDSTLVRLDPKTDEIAAVVEVGRGTKAVAVGGNTVWVYNVTEGTLTAIDPQTNEVRRVSRIATTPAESAPYNGPLLAADREGAWLVGSRDGQGILTRARLQSDVHREHPLVTSPEVGNPVAVAVGMGSVWVLTRIAEARSQAHEELLRIDPATGAIRRRTAFPHAEFGSENVVYGLALGAGKVWVTNVETGELFRVDPGSAAVTGKVDLGFTAAVPSTGYRSVWVVSGSDALRVDPVTLAVTRAGTARGELIDVAPGEGAVWANSFPTGAVYRLGPGGDTGSAIRLAAGATRAPAQGSAASASIAVGAGGVWVTVSPEGRASS